jgi:hypothetical protein
VDPQALIQQYQNEIAELKALLRMQTEGSGIALASAGGRSAKDEVGLGGFGRERR